jgi:hypothetical protein
MLHLKTINKGVNIMGTNKNNRCFCRSGKMGKNCCDKQLKAIDTEYDGHLFRSRLEARWAVFFKSMNMDYRYEEEGYELGIGFGRYLPDFWLPNLFGENEGAFIEIKANKPTKEEIIKCDRLSELSDKPVYLFFGDIGVPVTDFKTMPGFNSEQIKKIDIRGSSAIAFSPPSMRNGPVNYIFDLKCFAEDIDGELDIWPIYLDSMPLTNESYTKCTYGITLDGGFIPRVYQGKGRIPDSKRLSEAFLKAKSARFEFGETPK